MKNWTPGEILELGRSYQAACVLAAAADLDLFDVLAGGPSPAEDVARQIEGDLRATTILLDALAALGLITKSAGQYSLPAGIADCLTSASPKSVLAMAQHQANCLRRWAQLARTVHTGQPAEAGPSIRGQAADLAAFIGAMHNVSAPVASEVIRAIQPLQFNHLLDVGGASGTWTLAFLWACPSATATIFDLPEVLPMAERRLHEAGYADRVRLVPGDFMRDPLPAGADLIWISAIVHQNSRAQNRELFHNVFRALTPGGRIAIRDHVMDPTRTRPAAGALFAINMLVATEAGGTFTFDELKEDLGWAGFCDATLPRQDESMHCVVVARKARQ